MSDTAETASPRNTAFDIFMVLTMSVFTGGIFMMVVDDGRDAIRSDAKSVILDAAPPAKMPGRTHLLAVLDGDMAPPLETGSLSECFDAAKAAATRNGFIPGTSFSCFHMGSQTVTPVR